MIRFTVHGKAQAAGSKRHVGRGIIVDANKNAKPWQAEVKDAALKAYQGDPLEGPLAVEIRVYRMRPKGHFKTNGQLSAAGLRTPFPTMKPDVLKLARGIEDAMTGVIYRDDSQIVVELIAKAWGASERTDVAISEYTWLTLDEGELDLGLVATGTAG